MKQYDSFDLDLVLDEVDQPDDVLDGCQPRLPYVQHNIQGTNGDPYCMNYSSVSPFFAISHNVGRYVSKYLPT